jgi:uncharacterized membrane protein YhaH (DUF805 family)
MDFSQAVQTCLRKYADFSGRASRPEYWWFVLFVFGVGLLLHFVSHLLAGLFHLGMLIPGLAAASRRLHDTNRSGWWQLIGIVPVLGWIVLIVFLAQEGQPGSNEHGEAPSADAPPATA